MKSCVFRNTSFPKALAVATYLWEQDYLTPDIWYNFKKETYTDTQVWKIQNNVKNKLGESYE